MKTRMLFIPIVTLLLLLCTGCQSLEKHVPSVPPAEAVSPQPLALEEQPLAPLVPEEPTVPPQVQETSLPQSAEPSLAEAALMKSEAAPAEAPKEETIALAETEKAQGESVTESAAVASDVMQLPESVATQDELKPSEDLRGNNALFFLPPLYTMIIVVAVLLSVVFTIRGIRSAGFSRFSSLCITGVAVLLGCAVCYATKAYTLSSCGYLLLLGGYPILRFGNGEQSRPRSQGPKLFG